MDTKNLTKKEKKLMKLIVKSVLISGGSLILLLIFGIGISIFSHVQLNQLDKQFEQESIQRDKYQKSLLIKTADYNKYIKLTVLPQSFGDSLINTQRFEIQNISDSKIGSEIIIKGFYKKKLVSEKAYHYILNPNMKQEYFYNWQKGKINVHEITWKFYVKYIIKADTNGKLNYKTVKK